jgi:hypothetical protein
MSVRTELEAILAEAGVTITREQAQSIAYAVVARKSIDTMSSDDELRLRYAVLESVLDAERRLGSRMIGKAAEAYRIADLAMTIGLAECERLRASADKAWREVVRLQDVVCDREDEYAVAKEDADAAARMAVRSVDAHRIANLAMSVGLAECERLRQTIREHALEWVAVDNILRADDTETTVHAAARVVASAERTKDELDAERDKVKDLESKAPNAYSAFKLVESILGTESSRDYSDSIAALRDLRNDRDTLLARVKDLEVELMHKPSEDGSAVATDTELSVLFDGAYAACDGDHFDARRSGCRAVVAKVRAERKPCSLTEALRLGCDVRIREVTDETRPCGILWRVDVDGAQQAREVREPEDVMGAIAEQVTEVKATRMGRS